MPATIGFRYIINNAETEEVKTRAQDVLKWLNTCCFDNKKSLGSSITAEVKEAVNKELSKQRELFKYASNWEYDYILPKIHMFRQFLEDVENLEKKKEQEWSSGDDPMERFRKEEEEERERERKMEKMMEMDDEDLFYDGGRRKRRTRRRKKRKRKRKRTKKKRRKRRRRRTRKRK